MPKFSNRNLFCLSGAFGRRASDGGANLHIYYPATSNNQNVDNLMYSGQQTGDCAIADQQQQQQRCDLAAHQLEGGDESNDEIQM
jgi:hypothetical protein